MAYNEKLADRVRELIAASRSDITEKKMFGGLLLMVDDKMCVAIRSDEIMLRFDPALDEEIMEKNGTRPMVHGGKSMKGFVYVNEEELTTQKKLAYWVNLALDYNEKARSSKDEPKKRPPPESDPYPFSTGDSARYFLEGK